MTGILTETGIFVGGGGEGYGAPQQLLLKYGNRHGLIAGATIATPLDTLLAPGLRLQIDATDPANIPFNHCDKANCYVNFAIAPAELERLKKGSQIKMAVVPLFAPDKPVEVTISLKGFTAAYEQVAKSVAQ